MHEEEINADERDSDCARASQHRDYKNGVGIVLESVWLRSDIV